MGRNRKTYAESFKKAVALEAIEGKKQVAEIAGDHGISPSMVTAWKKGVSRWGLQQGTQETNKGTRTDQ